MVVKKPTAQSKKKSSSVSKAKTKKPNETLSEGKTSSALVEVVDNAAKKPKRARKIKTIFMRERILADDCDEARDLNNQSSFGVMLESGKLQLSLTEALYLIERKKIVVFDGRKKQLGFDEYVRRASRLEPGFWTRYVVFKDMRNRGYIIKTALKFGADFRVYDRGIKPGEDHARWIVYPVPEGEKYTWFDFAAKNRVAHSTKKRLMMGVVDDENDVTYWEIKWVRP